MPSNRLAFAVLAVACLAAAAGGGYLASLQNAPPGAAPVSAESLQKTASPSPSTVVTPSSTKTDTPDGELSSKTTTAAVRAQGSTAKRVETARPAASEAAPRWSSSAPASARVQEPGPVFERIGQSSSPALPTLPAPPAPAPTVSSAPSEPALPAQRPDDRAAQEAPRLPEPPQNTFQELVVSADSVIGLQAETSVSSERARVEDRVEARVTRDVRVRNMVAIPAGTRALGSVVAVERGGKFRERGRLGIRFNTLVLADGTRLPISTETIFREGEPPGKDSAAKIGGATVGGAILGAILGGGKGAAIGAAAGAGGGSAVAANGDRSTATLRSGEPITVRILAPLSVTIEQK